MTHPPVRLSRADHHSAGEPFRIVTGGVALPPGIGERASVLDEDDPLGRGFVLR